MIIFMMLKFILVIIKKLWEKEQIFNLYKFDILKIH